MDVGRSAELKIYLKSNWLQREEDTSLLHHQIVPDKSHFQEDKQGSVHQRSWCEQGHTSKWGPC